MTKLESKHPENATGAWYVTDQCINCGMCPEYAPHIFRESLDRDHAYVHHQPNTSEEQAAAQEAMESCPTEAIKNDGEATG